MRIVITISLFLMFQLSGIGQLVLTPNSGTAGTTFGVTISGSGFSAASSPYNGVIYNISNSYGFSGDYVNATTLDGTITLPLNAVPGTYDAIIYSSPSFCSNCFTILPTPIISANKSYNLQIDLNNNGMVNPGETVRFNVVVSNQDGAAEASNVVYSNPAISGASLVVGSVLTNAGSVVEGNNGGDTGVEINIGSMVASSTVNITFDVVVDGDFAGDKISCQGTISGSNFPDKVTDDPATAKADEPTIVPVFQIIPPQVSATKSDALILESCVDGLVNPGERIRFTVVVSNSPGAENATDVLFTSADLNNAALVAGSVTSSQGSITSGNSMGDNEVTVEIGTLTPASPTTITFDVDVDEFFKGTEIACQSEISGSNFSLVVSDDPDTGIPNDSTRVAITQKPAFVTATKTDALFSEIFPDGLLNQGETVRFTVVVTNTNPVVATPTNAASVTYSNAALNNASLVVGSVTASPQGAVISGNNGGDTEINVNIGTLMAGSSTTLTFDVVLDNPFMADEIVCQGIVRGDNFMIEVTDDPDTGVPDDSTRVPVVVIPPEISVSKSAVLVEDLMVDGILNKGESLKYVVTVTNSNSFFDAFQVIFNSDIPEHTTLDIGSVMTTQGSVILGNTGGDTEVEVDIGTLAGGASMTIEFQVVLNPNTPNTVGEIVCQSIVSGLNFEPVLSDDPDAVGTDDPTVTPVAVIPTLGQWGIIILFLLIIIFGRIRMGTSVPFEKVNG